MGRSVVSGDSMTTLPLLLNAIDPAIWSYRNWQYSKHIPNRWTPGLVFLFPIKHIIFLNPYFFLRYHKITSKDSSVGNMGGGLFLLVFHITTSIDSLPLNAGKTTYLLMEKHSIIKLRVFYQLKVHVPAVNTREE